MERKKPRISKRIVALTLCLIFLALSILLFIKLFFSAVADSSAKYSEDDIRSYHVIITGTYENQLFMQKVYEGALKQADKNSAIVELYVPETQASNVSLQKLLDYCVYVNADGIIAFVDSPDEQITLLTQSQEHEIPLITTGQFAPDVHQISFIGSGYWELGKKVAEEILSFSDQGRIVVINEFLSTNSNYNNLINSMQTTLRQSQGFETQVLASLESDFTMDDENNIFVCLTEDSTIRTAQMLEEEFPDSNYNVIGFGSNEACQIYLQKGLVSELISLDPEKIGETAISELFEYRNKGYANSYIAADVQITKARR